MRFVLTITAVLAAAAIAYVSPQVAAHRDPTLVYLRENGKRPLIPLIFPANTHRSTVHAYFIERGFRGPLKMTRNPDGSFYADEGWKLNNLFWLYAIRLIYDDEGMLTDGWGGAARPGTK